MTIWISWPVMIVMLSDDDCAEVKCFNKETYIFNKKLK